MTRLVGGVSVSEAIWIPTITTATAPSTMPTTGLLPTVSAHLDQFLQAAETGRDLFALGADAAAPIGVADLADINVAARIDRDAVRRDELAGVEPGMLVPEPRQQLALMGVDADPRPTARQIDVDRH